MKAAATAGCGWSRKGSRIHEQHFVRRQGLEGPDADPDRVAGEAQNRSDRDQFERAPVLLRLRGVRPENEAEKDRLTASRVPFSGGDEEQEGRAVLGVVAGGVRVEEHELFIAAIEARTNSVPHDATRLRRSRTTATTPRARTCEPNWNSRRFQRGASAPRTCAQNLARAGTHRAGVAGPLRPAAGDARQPDTVSGGVVGTRIARNPRL